MEYIALLRPERVEMLFLDFMPRLLAAIGIGAGFWLLQRITVPALRTLLHHAGFDPSLTKLLIDNIYRGTLFIFAVVMAAGQLGINVTAALAGISVAGLAVGFAAQDSLANMIAGFLIFWDKPFRVGDFLTFDDRYGRVVEITMRTTRIRTQENTYVVIPNKHIADTVLVNHTKHGEIRLNLAVGIAYKEQIAHARSVLLGAVAGVEGVLKTPEPDVVVAALGSSSVDLLVRVWVNQPEFERPVFYRALEACKTALDDAGIEIPFPHLQLFVEEVNNRVWERLASERPAGSIR
jgi:small conductance mechanosensitive channel